MSQVEFGDPDTHAAKWAGETFHYSQFVKLPNGIVKLSGQGGWDDDLNFPPKIEGKEDYKAQIDRAFDNITTVLRAAGLKGLEDVYLVRSYLTNLPEHFPYLTEVMKKRFPQKPVYTSLSVPALGLETMVVEIEVEAWKGAN